MTHSWPVCPLSARREGGTLAVEHSLSDDASSGGTMLGWRSIVRARFPIPTMLSCSIVLVTALFGAAPVARSATAPQPIPLAPPSVVFGEVRLANLSVNTWGDLDGDGAEDLLLGWFPATTRFAYQVAVAMGRREWPASTGLSRLPALHSLGMPGVDDYSPNAPVYYVQQVADIDGDGTDDLVVRKDEYRARDRIASEARVYLGHPGWGPIDVRTTAPDITIRQDRDPWTPSEAGRFQVPDVVLGGDFNGDGRRDIAVGSCGVLPRNADGVAIDDGPAPLQLFFGPATGWQRIDLGKTKPDVEITGSRELEEQVGCYLPEHGVDDVNGDGTSDLLLSSGSSWPSLKGYIVYGRAEWPGSAKVADVGSAVLEHHSATGGVVVWPIEDLNADGRYEIVADYYDDRAAMPGSASGSAATLSRRRRTPPTATFG